MGSILYTSEDTSAPELRPLNGSLINVFKKCLVEGYGSKESLGWTIEHEDVARNICVFRMKSGSKTYLRVEDNGAPNTMNAIVQAYETMSDVDTGIHPCIPETEATYKLIRKNDTTTDHAVIWRIVGDDKGFYFIIRPYSTLATTPTTVSQIMGQAFYFGDYIPYRQEDKNNFMMNAATTTIARCYFQPVANVGFSNGFRMMRDIDDEKGSIYCGMGGCSSYITSFGNFTVSLSPLGGRFMYLPVTVHTSTNVMGVMPGLMHPFHKFETGWDLSDVQEFYESDANGIYGLSLCINYGTAITSPQRILLIIGDNFRNAY